VSHDHWNQHARQWQFVGPPLRPTAEDVELFEQLVDEGVPHAREPRHPPRAALLGVTPELAAMRWPEGTRLAAFDRCPGMLAEIWPRASLGPSAAAVRADWRELPVADATFDVVIGDGCYTLVDCSAGYRAVGAAVARALAPGGAFVMRFFVRPETPESVDDVFAGLRAATIGSFHAFKWRLAMALHGALDQGVRVAEVWKAWHEHEGDADALAARLGWRAAEVRTIDAYRNADARYTFPTLAEARAILSLHFVEETCRFGSYELGERCPTLRLRRRSDQAPLAASR
jgi:SAM-dependent methyltransferase